MSITVTNKISGELIDFATDTPEQILQAYRQAKEFEDMGKRLKDKLKPLLPSILDEQGRSPEVDGYILKAYQSQRMNYSVMALRNVFDEDTLSLFMKPQKGLIDKYIKENPLDADQVSELKNGLEPDGAVIESVRLERVG